MRRLIWGVAGRIYHIVGNLMSRLNYVQLKIYTIASNFYQNSQIIQDSMSSFSGKKEFLDSSTTLFREGFIFAKVSWK